MTLKTFLLEFFTWWNGQTLGTRLFTWRKGEFVGEDEVGNRYYQERGGKRRRWVIYNGEADGSRATATWHGWLHYRVDTPPNKEPYTARPWEAPYQPNLTGTPAAYRPPGSIVVPRPRDEATGDYDAWRPE